MKEVWSKPEVTEQEVGLEVTSYLPAEIEATCSAISRLDVQLARRSSARPRALIEEGFDPREQDRKRRFTRSEVSKCSA